MILRKIREIQEAVSEQAPLIHCITNPISINACANLVLAVGARPIMAEHPKEVAEITATAQALMLNLGNITDARMESMRISAKTARNQKIPVMLDLVGLACSKLRKEYARNMLTDFPVTLIKGNYSEIHALYREEYTGSGVDADQNLTLEITMESAKAVAKKYKTMVLASGKTDLVTDGKEVYLVKNGVAQMSRVTGTGCMLGALATTYLAVSQNVEAVVGACVVFGVCGELSVTEKENGTFAVNLMDHLSNIGWEDIRDRMQVEKIENK